MEDHAEKWCTYQYRENSLKIKNYLSSSVLFIFAVIMFFQSKTLIFWDEEGPAEGFFPLVSCLLLLFLSLTIFVRAYLQTEQSKEIFQVLGPRKWKLLLYIGSFFTFGLIFTTAGYSLTPAGFLVFMLRIIERQSWKISLIITVASLTVSYLIFGFLNVIIPEGILSPVINLLRYG